MYLILDSKLLDIKTIGIYFKKEIFHIYNIVFESYQICLQEAYFIRQIMALRF